MPKNRINLRLALIVAILIVIYALRPFHSSQLMYTNSRQSIFLYDNPDFANVVGYIEPHSTVIPCEKSGTSLTLCAGTSRFYIKLDDVSGIKAAPESATWKAATIEHEFDAYTIGFLPPPLPGTLEDSHPAAILIPRDPNHLTLLLTPVESAIRLNVESSSLNSQRTISWQAVAANTVELTLEVAAPFGVDVEWVTRKKLRIVPKSELPKKRILVLDPGHGGRDSGACTDRLCEKNLTLEAAQILKQQLSSDTLSVQLTREADLSMDLPSRVSFAQKAGADFFISLHFDEWKPPLFSLSKIPSGLSCYYFSPLSRNLAANSCGNAFDRGIKTTWTAQRSLYVLNTHSYPSILLELLNMADTNDLEMIKSEERFHSYIKEIAQGLRQTIDSQMP